MRALLSAGLLPSCWAGGEETRPQSQSSTWAARTWLHEPLLLPLKACISRCSPVGYWQLNSSRPLYRDSVNTQPRSSKMPAGGAGRYKEQAGA